jgi:SAM-dependent methyltransferase
LDGAISGAGRRTLSLIDQPVVKPLIKKNKERFPGWLKWVLSVFVIGFGATIAWQYPTDSDNSYSPEEIQKTLSFYKQAYAAPQAQSPTPDDDIYIRVAREAADQADIDGRVTRFARRFNLGDRDKKVLEVGSGRGYLQDVVPNYTGLDISPSVKRFYHKPFVLGSATAMPFPDASFDGLWSIWVLEHVPNPEQALREIRRVVKDGGVVYLFPAWNCIPWAAEGYEVRPFSDFDWRGKLTKATVPIRQTVLWWYLTEVPTRAVRAALTNNDSGASTFTYRRLEPNYKKYWVSDSDAVNSLDRVEMARWFTSRGDECLNCQAMPAALSHLDVGEPLIVKIHKQR